MKQFASSFLLLILVGTMLLLLPFSTYQGISWVDALFTAASAVCITGLVTVDIPLVFTFFGQWVILILIQLGGLGMLTITSLFVRMFMVNPSINSRLVVMDVLNSKSLASLFSTLLYIVGFTLAFEVVGALLIYVDIRGSLGMDASHEVFFSLFHSVSAFCNAGFSTLSGNLGNPVILHHHDGMYLTLSFLIIAGGIGFPILVNLCEMVVYEVKRFYSWYVRGNKMPQRVHLYNLNTRIALSMTAFLLVVGALSILLLEWNGAFKEMSAEDKVVHALFNAVCPRTAGFNSVSLVCMHSHTILIVMVLMVIGGGTQSTAGGVKVNVFAVVLMNLRAVLSNAPRARAFHREISIDSVRRSNATLIFYLLTVFSAFFLLTFLEPDIHLLALLFECISALSTVGLSLDVTPLLGSASKLLLVLLMFVGRVGLFTLVASVMGRPKERYYRFPSDDIIIN